MENAENEWIFDEEDYGPESDDELPLWTVDSTHHPEVSMDWLFGELEGGDAGDPPAQFDLDFEALQGLED